MTSGKKEMGGVFDQMFATDEVKKRILRTYAA